jgi:hypothetical protein
MSGMSVSWPVRALLHSPKICVDLLLFKRGSDLLEKLRENELRNVACNFQLTSHDARHRFRVRVGPGESVVLAILPFTVHIF